MKQRREKVPQNAKDRKLGKANAQVALQASIRADRASDDNTDDAIIGDDNTDDAVIGNDNTDDAVIGDDNTDDAVTGDDNIDKAVTGKASTVHVPLPPHSKEKAKDPSQIKTSSKHATPIAEPSIHDPFWMIMLL